MVGSINRCSNSGSGFVITTDQLLGPGGNSAISANYLLPIFMPSRNQPRPFERILRHGCAPFALRTFYRYELVKRFLITCCRPSLEIPSLHKAFRCNFRSRRLVDDLSRLLSSPTLMLRRLPSPGTVRPQNDCVLDPRFFGSLERHSS